MKDAAALGRNGADALRDAVLRFFADIEARGVPSTADLDTRACASDVLTLVRAANGCAETPRSEDGKDDSGALRRGVDALVADLVAADALALDAEVVAVLCAYYVSRLEAARAARDPAGASSSSATFSDKNAADAYKAVAALARTGGSAFFPDAETESLVALAIGDLRAFVTEKDSRRAVLDALGAVVGRVPASALSARSHADVGEALAGLLDELETPSSGRPSSGPGPSADPRSVRAYALPFSSDHTLVLEESVAASRYYAALWRCAHLCASRDGARWPEPVVARLAGRVPALPELRRRKRLSGRNERDRDRDRERCFQRARLCSPARARRRVLGLGRERRGDVRARTFVRRPVRLEPSPRQRRVVRREFGARRSAKRAFVMAGAVTHLRGALRT